MSPKSSPFNFLIFCHRTNVKNPNGSLFSIFFGTMRLSLKFLFFRFFRKFFKDSKESPFNFLKFCNRMDIEKSQRAPFYSFVRNFKMDNFCLKIRFSQAQHAISDFCFFKDRCFFYALFLKFVSPKPLLNFCQKRNVLRELRTPQGFRH